MVRCAPCSPTSTACAEVDRDAEVVGEEVAGAGGEDREHDRLGADGVDAPLHHAVAAPDEEQVGAVVDAPCARTSGANLLFGHLEPHAGRRHQRAASTLRSSVKPPPSVFRAWATTATEVMTPPPRGEALVAVGVSLDAPLVRLGQPGPDREVADDDARRTDQRAADHVGRVVHAAVRRATWPR